MNIVQVSWHPTDRQLRQFGALCAVIFPFATWLWSLPQAWMACASIAGVLLGLLSWWKPAAVKPLFIGITLTVLPVGFLLGEVVLLLVYWIVFVPMGIVFRCLGRDRLQRRIDRSCSSYWEVKPQPRSLASYYRQS